MGVGPRRVTPGIGGHVPAHPITGFSAGSQVLEPRGYCRRAPLCLSRGVKRRGNLSTPAGFVLPDAVIRREARFRGEVCGKARRCGAGAPPPSPRKGAPSQPQENGRHAPAPPRTPTSGGVYSWRRHRYPRVGGSRAEIGRGSAVVARLRPGDRGSAHSVLPRQRAFLITQSAPFFGARSLVIDATI